MRQYLLANCVEEDGPLETKCLVFTGPRNAFGYGKASYEGTSQNAHRVAWEVFAGPIPDSLWVLHRCDNPPCTRISHLYLGDQSNNMQDMWDRGRHPGTGACGLSEKDVLEARNMAAEGYSHSFIAECLGTARRTITDIVRGETRASVGGPITIIDRPKSSKFVGVIAEHGKWRAQLSINGVQHHLGTFGFEGDGGIAYNFHVAWLGLKRPLNVITEADWHHD
jgi:hypothetical protein